MTHYTKKDAELAIQSIRACLIGSDFDKQSDYRETVNRIETVSRKRFIELVEYCAVMSHEYSGNSHTTLQLKALQKEFEL